MTATLWTASAAAAATGGQATRDWSATGVSIDTRTLAPGDLFVALTDARDGHDFVVQALARGAAAALVSRIPDGVAPDAPLLIVPDVLTALAALGRAARTRTTARVIGITGSVGKTSTKEMLRSLLSGQGRVHAAEKSYNNHWGVPLTLARMPADTDFAVIEIGMNAPGEIAPLARMSQLDVGVITIVAPAHLAAFASIDGIAHEKAALLDGLVPGGTAILNADIATAPILLAKADSVGARTVRFGAAPGCDWRLTDVRVTEDATVIQADTPVGPLLFRLSVPGAHFAPNAVAALAAAAACGADPVRAALDLARWVPPDGRGTRTRVVLDPIDDGQSFDLIDDAFNANPASVAAALDMLAAARPRDGVGRIGAGRRIAVLGDMLELGPDEARFHADLARHPAMATIDRVHCLGPRMAALWDTLPPARRGERHDRADDMAARARALVDAGDVVLVKGSKSSHASRVADALRALAPPRAPSGGASDPES
ncbi:MAG: UDP-N-acetylmuramoyl-tripeptide--D-alanyl-D-alanine ligase [Rhodobacteraceae bacterium]|nr:UDP-N-acetylmuramoyl-tripeptide--D-alanyl-D-alanine ligase [Paracoccaceae bacterium]